MSKDRKTEELIASRYLGEWNIEALSELPKNTLGHRYAKHMIDNGLDPDFFPKLETSTAHAWLQMRSRQTHDIWHAVTGFSTSVVDETGLQAFNYAQLRSPASVVIIAMFLLHAALFKREILAEMVDAVSRGWTMGKAAKPLFGEKFEDEWTTDLGVYRQRLNLA